MERGVSPQRGLSREVLEPLVAAGGTHRSMASALGVSAAAVRYWLQRHQLRTVRQHRRHEIPPDQPERLELECRRHGRTMFVKRSGDGSYRCLRCRSEQVSKQRRRLKAILVEEAGGRCQVCGYDRWPGALHFHHVEPGEKAFALSQEGSYRSLERARTEARKCTLLCANCHAEVEGGFRTLTR